MSELKPCPFCGKMPSAGVEFYESNSMDGIKLRASVYCSGCHISRGVVFKATDQVSLVPFLDYEVAFDKVKKAWNKRVGEADEGD